MEIYSKVKRNQRLIPIWKQKQFNYKNSKIVKKTLMFKEAPEATTQTKKRRTVIQEVKGSSARNSEIDICKLSIKCNRMSSILDILTN